MIDYTLPLEQLPDPLPIQPLSKPFDVTITPPGSKSITCRAYVLAALAEGESKIIRPLRADDTDLLLKALCTLGAEARWEGEDVFIKGVAGRFPRGGSVNLGDGGTPTRFMIACACLAAEPVIVDGSPRMRERPIAEGVEMLRQLGAKIDYVEAEGCLPVRVTPCAEFKGGKLHLGRTESSQFVSALMLIAPFLPEGLDIVFDAVPTSASYITLTRHLLGFWRSDLTPPKSEGTLTHQFWSGLDEVACSGLHISSGALSARSFAVESDASSGAYWFVAAWVAPPSQVRVYQFGRSPIQPDLRLLLELKSSNLADITLGMQHRYNVHYWELARGRKTGKLKCDCGLFPDGALALIVGATLMKNRSRFTGLSTLRVKETDRIAALANELRKIGCTVQTGEDWIGIDPSTRHDDPVTIETYNDHRMAMAFAVLGLARPGISIRNPACVRKSYPTFWRDFAKLYQ